MKIKNKNGKKFLKNIKNFQEINKHPLNNSKSK